MKSGPIFMAFFVMICGIFTVPSYATSQNNTADTPGTAKWKFSLPASEVGNVIAIGRDKKIYALDDDGNLRAFNPSDGSLAWKVNLDAYGNVAIAIGKDGTIYAVVGPARTADHNYLYAFDSSGAQKWKVDLVAGGMLSPHMAIAQDGTIYACTDKSLFAINPDGSSKWQRSSFTEGGKTLQSLIVGNDGTIYLVGGENDGDVLYLIDPKDGKDKEWALTLPGNHSKLAIDSEGNIVVTCKIGTFDTELAVISPSLKETLWDYDLNSGGDISAPVVGRDGTIYFTFDNGPATLYALTHKGNVGMVKWTFANKNISEDYVNTPAIDSNEDIICSMGPIAYAIGPDGKKKWSFWPSLSGMYYASNITIGNDGTVYATLAAYGDNNYLYAITTSSKGLDSQAPWPKWNKDIYNSGNPNFTNK